MNVSKCWGLPRDEVWIMDGCMGGLLFEGHCASRDSFFKSFGFFLLNPYEVGFEKEEEKVRMMG